MYTINEWRWLWFSTVQSISLILWFLDHWPCCKWTMVCMHKQWNSLGLAWWPLLPDHFLLFFSIREQLWHHWGNSTNIIIYLLDQLYFSSSCSKVLGTLFRFHWHFWGIFKYWCKSQPSHHNYQISINCLIQKNYTHIDMIRVDLKITYL